MNLLSKTEKRILPDTYGAIALASLLICTVSGIVLAIPYDVTDPLDSIKTMLLTNPAAVLFRNLHYWSAQFFLVFTILHFWDHLFRATESRVKKGVWFRLVISVFFIFFVMLSGFILKGDQDSLQAGKIFRALLETIPSGQWIALALLGREDSFQILYIQHVSTATLFLFIITFEHARTIWTKAGTFLIVSGILLLFSFLFQAPLQTHAGNIIKGPWYFLGFQEILHWTHSPWIVIAALLLLFLTVIFLPQFRKGLALMVKKGLLVLFTFYLLLTISGYFFRGENWSWTWDTTGAYFPFQPVPLNPGTYFSKSDPSIIQEGCMLCHMPVGGFSPSHDPAAIGCSSCHLGNPYTPNQREAHRSMILIPGNLQQASQTCGTANCHPEIISRMDLNIMTTLSGMVSVDRYVFGESETLSDSCRITEIGHTPAGMHLRNLCAHCHIGNEKTEWGPVTQHSRGGGCNACHLQYSAESHQELLSYLQIRGKDTLLMRTHPALNIRVRDDHCFGCHSRSGRISLNYTGWHETLLEADKIPDTGTFKVLEDRRVLTHISGDIHHTAGMECIDCHLSVELMGDGIFHRHKEEQVKIGCEDCHFSGSPNIAKYIDAESAKIIKLRGWDGDTILMLRTGTGYPMINTRIQEGKEPLLILKNSGKALPMKAPAEICTRGKGHARLSCGSCHSAWIPQCIGCHNEYDHLADGYDLLKNKAMQGSWVEYVGKFVAAPPVLGVRNEPETDNAGTIITFTPGMVLSIAPGTYPGQEKTEKPIFHRLFAPSEPHTTMPGGRDCRSCHLDPLMMGFGSGKLEYTINKGKGTWEFFPAYAPNGNDGLPEDAWTGFLEERNAQAATRYHHRPFNLEEQQHLLLVGACLHCHDQKGKTMQDALDDFEETLLQRSRSCILPVWEEKHD